MDEDTRKSAKEKVRLPSSWEARRLQPQVEEGGGGRDCSIREQADI